LHCAPGAGRHTAHHDHARPAPRSPARPGFLAASCSGSAPCPATGGRCAVPTCTSAATDAHHILNRALFTAAHERGGYFLENSANLCGPHHLDAEQTTIRATDLYTWCHIEHPARPEHLADDTDYDTWGNPILPDGTCLMGELFYTPGCQRALAGGGHLSRYQTRFKYPRTLHAPWSPGLSGNDKVQHDLGALTGQQVVITLKLDGEATTIGWIHRRKPESSSLD